MTTVPVPVDIAAKVAPIGPSCSWTERTGLCAHCSSRFHVTVWQEAPRFCCHCRAAFEAWTAGLPAPATTVPDGFTADQYERALARADADRIRLEPTSIPGTFRVTNRRTRSSYLATAGVCTCEAWQHGTPCKHRAAVFAALVAVNLTADTRADRIARMEANIAEERAERHRRLVREASHLGIEFSPDDVHPGAWIARQPDQLGRCEVVTATTCTCRRFRLFDRCPHHALLTALETVGQAQDCVFALIAAEDARGSVPQLAAAAD